MAQQLQNRQNAQNAAQKAAAQQAAANKAREEAEFWAGVNAALAFQEAERKARQEAEFWAGVNAALAFQEAERQQAARQAAQNAAQQAAQQAAQNAAYKAAEQRDRDQAAQIAAQQTAHQSAQVATQEAAHQAAVDAATPQPEVPSGCYDLAQCIRGDRCDSIAACAGLAGSAIEVEPVPLEDKLVDWRCTVIILCAMHLVNGPEMQVKQPEMTPEEKANQDMMMMAFPVGGGEVAGAKGLAAVKGLIRLGESSTLDRALAKALEACSFAGSTTVLMADGTTKPIEDIRVGDKVIATDPETGEQKPESVTHLWIHHDELTDLVLADGTVLTTTEDHPYWSVDDQQFEPASELAPGEKVLGADGETVAVTGLAPLTMHDGLAYNLSVSEIHTYHVGYDEILVHNECGPDLGARWTPKPASAVCGKGGCEAVADRIQSLIGGDVMRITDRYGAPGLGKFRGVDSGWTYQDVVVKDGRVFDATTGRYGESIAEYRAHWEYGDDLVFNPAPR